MLSAYTNRNTTRTRVRITPAWAVLSVLFGVAALSLFAPQAWVAYTAWCVLGVALYMKDGGDTLLTWAAAVIFATVAFSFINQIVWV